MTDRRSACNRPSLRVTPKMSQKLTPSQQVLQSCELVVAQARNVSIKSLGVQNTAKWIKYTQCNYSWDEWRRHELHPRVGLKTTLIPEFAAKDVLNWVFMMDLLNYSFWQSPHEERYKVTYNGTTYTGYWTLNACILRAL